MQLVSEAEEKLASIAKDKAQYKSLLTDLLVQVRGVTLPHTFQAHPSAGPSS